MKILPLAVTFTAAALLMGCGRPAADTSQADKEDRDRVAEEQLARQQSQLHEQQAALDERERALNERQSLLTVANPPPTPPPAPAPVEQAPPADVAPQPPAAENPEGAPDASLQQFYDALSAYGTWMQMAPYGYVWQPTVTLQDQNWRPYTEGHWVDTDEGWTWVSDEPFGWATYHYGRWMRTHTQGWVWVPGNQWAPAWVSWRYGNDFVGWAPLPPEATLAPGRGIQQWADRQYDLSAADYTFVPAAEFGDDSMAPEEVPLAQNPAIYDESNNVTNMYYGDGGYSIICYGPNYDFLRSKSHRHLPPPYKLSRGGYHSNGDNHAVVSGNTLTVPAPRIVAAGKPAAPKHAHSTVFDARLVTIPPAPPPHGSGFAPLPSPARAAAVQPAAPASARYQPVTIPNMSAPVRSALQTSGNAPGGVPVITHAMPPTVIAPGQSAAQAQQSRDQQIIQQQQAQRALEQQRRDAVNAQAEQQTEFRANAQRTAEAERAQAEAVRARQVSAAEAEARAQVRAAQSQAAQAQAAQAEAAQQAARQQAYRGFQPTVVPAGTQGTGLGRNQQQ